MNRRILLAIAVAVAAAVAVATAAAVLPADHDKAAKRDAALSAGHPERCRTFNTENARDCYAREFLAMVDGRKDPRPAVEAITKAAREEGGFLLSNCHVVMHTVGRNYAQRAGVTLATLMDYLPRDNDPGCPAGFAHGLVTGVAPDVNPNKPRDALQACSSAGTRFQRYSCIHGFGHAFMRIYADRLDRALPLCTALGRGSAADCAQGAYHDYWFSVLGADDTTPPAQVVKDPRQLCAAQPAAYVRPCWYRAFLENREGGFQLESPGDLQSLCEGLDGVQRGGCITAAALIGPPDPAAQLAICARLGADAADCVRGTKVQNLLNASTDTYVKLIERCQRFTGGARGACYRWLGKALAVLTDGAFEREGCPKLSNVAARRDCVAGARTMNDALVTFS